MDNYQPLKVFKYNHAGNNAAYDAEYHNRFSALTTYRTNLKPNIMSRGKFSTSKYPIFVVNLPSITIKTEQILTNSVTIKAIATNLPGIAATQFLLETMGNEIVSTNEIEGVKSTRQEVDEAIVSINEKKSKQRLTSTVKKYQDILDGDFLRVEQLSDIRKIYDSLLEGEIAEADLPDGELFRTKPVFIQGGNVDKKVLSAPTNEADIDARLTDWLLFINQHDTPFMLRALIGHYFFENTHPFYDGNGRTGRYILSMYLARRLDIFTGISFSQSVKSNRAKYYKAFSETGDVDNMADGTIFVIAMMDIILDSQQAIIHSLTEKSEQLKTVDGRIQEDFAVGTPEHLVLNLLAQSTLFNNSTTTGIIDNEIATIGSHSGLSIRGVKEAIKNLTEAGEIKLIKRRPMQHVLAEKYLAEI